MSGLESDSQRIKKTILLRYPFNLFEELSRQLIIYKSFRGNSKRSKCLMVMNELIDYATLDTETGKRVYDLQKYDEQHLVFIPKTYVEAFKYFYLGDANGYLSNGMPALMYLSPPAGMNPKEDLVTLRRAVPLSKTWKDKPSEYSALVAGFSYKIQVMTPQGFPTTETVPMINSWDDESIAGYMTYTVPWGFFSETFDEEWNEIAPICTIIEKIVAKKLEEKGFKQGETEAPTGSTSNDGDDGESEYML